MYCHDCHSQFLAQRVWGVSAAAPACPQVMGATSGFGAFPVPWRVFWPGANSNSSEQKQSKVLINVQPKQTAKKKGKKADLKLKKKELKQQYRNLQDREAEMERRQRELDQQEREIEKKRREIEKWTHEQQQLIHRKNQLQFDLEKFDKKIVHHLTTRGQKILELDAIRIDTEIQKGLHYLFVAYKNNWPIVTKFFEGKLCFYSSIDPEKKTTETTFVILENYVFEGSKNGLGVLMKMLSLTTEKYVEIIVQEKTFVMGVTPPLRTSYLKYDELCHAIKAVYTKYRSVKI
jgi:hypothetical protein